jgi:L-lactate dehydrogenase complex protein LldG
MSEREALFARIREALSVKAVGHDGGLPSVPEQRRVLPAVGSTEAEQLALFQKNAADLHADFQQFSSEGDLQAKVRELCQAEGWKKIATHNGKLANAVAQSLGVPVLNTADGYDKHELAACDAGITECDALVAQTGSVLVTTLSAGGRALSCLPPHHVVVARRDQLVPDLPAALELLQQKYGTNYPSMISFITGPSRTGDIERILVLGAHGPKKLTILVI